MAGHETACAGSQDACDAILAAYQHRLPGAFRRVGDNWCTICNANGKLLGWVNHRKKDTSARVYPYAGGAADRLVQEFEALGVAAYSDRTRSSPWGRVTPIGPYVPAEVDAATLVDVHIRVLVEHDRGLLSSGSRAWRRLFEVGDRLVTEFKHSPLVVQKFTKQGIEVRLPGRGGNPSISLSYERLEALRDCYERVMAAPRMLEEVNDVWTAYGLPNDSTNESQYWAVVCEARRRDGLDDETEYREGGRSLVSFSRAERSSKLRRACIRKYGTSCHVCGMNFKALYGKIGDGFIHVHHLTPVSEAAKKRKVKVDELRPVCPNCHAMLHQSSPPLSLESLKEMLRR